MDIALSTVSKPNRSRDSFPHTVRNVSRPPSPLPHSLPATGFTCAQARAVGISRSRLRASDLHSPYWGIRAATRTLDPIARIRAAEPLLTHGRALGSISAAQFLGLPLPHHLRDHEKLIVASPASTHRIKRNGIRSIRIRDDRFETVRFDGIPLLAPKTLAASLARDLSPMELTVVLDAMRSGAANYPGRRYLPQALLDPRQIRSLPGQFAGMHGIATLRTACALSADGVESPMETVLRVRLIESGFPVPEVNSTIQLGNGR